MSRILLFVLSTIYFLATPLLAMAQPPDQVVSKPADPVFVLNTDRAYIFAMLGVGIVNALILVMIWSKVATLSDAVQKAAASEKTTTPAV